MPKPVKEEDWDKDIPERFILEDGKTYELKILDVQFTKNQWNKNVLVITTDKGKIMTGAWDVINTLRANKPVIGKTMQFTVVGKGIARRFVNLKVF